MNPPDGKPETSDIDADPEKIARLLEVEMMQKRAAWQRAGAQRNTLRVLAFVFLFAIIAGAVAIYFFFVAGAPRSRTPRDEPATASSPTR